MAISTDVGDILSIFGMILIGLSLTINKLSTLKLYSGRS